MSNGASRFRRQLLPCRPESGQTASTQPGSAWFVFRCPLRTGRRQSCPHCEQRRPEQENGSRHGNSLTAQPSGNALSYLVSFENLATATGAAQTVSVTDQLDPSRVDLATFSLGAISFGSYSIVPAPGQTTFSKVLDLRPAKNFLVKVDARLNSASGLVTWRFSTLDPATGQATDDPVLGFLPPNVNPPAGDGSVSFSVLPLKNSPSGTQICNKASIVLMSMRRSSPTPGATRLTTLRLSAESSLYRRSRVRQALTFSGAEPTQGLPSLTSISSRQTTTLHSRPGCRPPV